LQLRRTSRSFGPPRKLRFKVLDEIVKTYSKLFANHAQFNYVNPTFSTFDFTYAWLPKGKFCS